ncbi:carboxymuconolactone decarboxylase family protein [Mesorhizobium sp. WSM4884]|uniref:carboxymuconolactone decarboxylase family protein n=1 Tax=Mesorhizobium sp. WSM4884 TaxID=3038542 RepID=UPI002416BA31|nr:carboxymuconolactone decarboxylase family protein [Mesorhizobium sp. WSM4884]
MKRLIRECRQTMAQEANGRRFERGMEVLRRIGGEGFDLPIKRLAEASPDLARFMVEYPYGDILSRPGLDLPLRQICTVSCLMALGSVQPQLKFHMTGFLNAGGRPQDLVELLFVSVAVLGFPCAVDSIALVREIFQERRIAFEAPPPASDDGTQRYRRGLEVFSAVHGEDYLRPLETISPELARWSIEFAFGEALSREGLEPKARHLAIISMLAATGNRNEALDFHLKAALKQGVSPAEIAEALMQLSVYAGFPAALNAFGLARQAFSADRDATAIAAPSAAASESREVRRARGLATLAQTSGASGEAVIRSFDDIAPDIGRMIVEHSYGDIFSRPGIDPKTRELTACAALAAVATKTAEAPLRVHINAALNAGASRKEVLETLLNLVPYSGYPVVQQAVRIAGEEFAKRPE